MATDTNRGTETPILAEVERRAFYAGIPDEDTRNMLEQSERKIRQYHNVWRPGKMETITNTAMELGSSQCFCQDARLFSHWMNTRLPFSGTTAKRWIVVSEHLDILEAEYDRIPHHILIGVASLAEYLSCSDEVREMVCSGAIGNTIRDMQAAERVRQMQPLQASFDIGPTYDMWPTGAVTLDQLELLAANLLNVIRAMMAERDER